MKAGGEQREILDAGVHRSRGTNPAALVMRLHATVGPPAIGQVAREIGVPGHARIAHAEAIEHPALHLGPQVEAEALLQHELEQDDAFARISVAAAGCEVEAQPPVRLVAREVGEAGAVGQQGAGRNRPPGRPPSISATARPRAPVLAIAARASCVTRAVGVAFDGDGAGWAMPALALQQARRMAAVLSLRMPSISQDLLAVHQSRLAGQRRARRRAAER